MLKNIINNVPNFTIDDFSGRDTSLSESIYDDMFDTEVMPLSCSSVIEMRRMDIYNNTYSSKIISKPVRKLVAGITFKLTLINDSYDIPLSNRGHFAKRMNNTAALVNRHRISKNLLKKYRLRGIWNVC